MSHKKGKNLVACNTYLEVRSNQGERRYGHHLLQISYLAQTSVTESSL